MSIGKSDDYHYTINSVETKARGCPIINAGACCTVIEAGENWYNSTLHSLRTRIEQLLIRQTPMY